MECNRKIALAEKLDLGWLKKKRAVVGFDGFIDEIMHVVDKRTSQDEFVRINYMKDFGNRIVKGAGLSTNIEMITVNKKTGGNGPIFSKALLEYGVGLTYIGAVGVPSIHPIFMDMAERCRMLPLCEPSHTDAIEFLDGKVISSKLDPFKNINWEMIKEQIGVNQLIELFEECDLIGFENWTMIYAMSDIWRHFLSEVMPQMKMREHKPIIFFDLADPEKRKAEEVLEALRLIGQFRSFCKVVLGLNKKEACEIGELFGLKILNYDDQMLEPLAKYVYSKMDVDVLVVHPVKEACAIQDGGYYQVAGPYCENPRLTTGAGDNFNAGFILGILSQMSLHDALLLGSATSGYYVRNAKSPTIGQVTKFLIDWGEGLLED